MLEDSCEDIEDVLDFDDNKSNVSRLMEEQPIA
jgi:hypothetical protein